MANLSTDKETKELVALLGGPRVFPARITNARDLQSALRKGLPFAAFEAVRNTLQFSTQDLAVLLGVAARTLARRKISQTLSPIESDRLYRVARTAQQATVVFGSLEQARKWLLQGNQALGGDSPISLLDTEIGERQVEELLNRINYGVFS